MTLSGAVASLVRANSADVPGVTFSRTCLMKSSSMPTSNYPEPRRITLLRTPVSRGGRMSRWVDAGRDQDSVLIMETTLSVGKREVEGEYLRRRKWRSPALVAGPGRRDRRRSLWVDPAGGPGSIAGLASVAAWHLPVGSGHLPPRGHLFGFLFLGLEAGRGDPVPHSRLCGTRQPPLEHHRGLYVVGNTRG